MGSPSLQQNKLYQTIFPSSETSFDIDNRARGKGASVWPVEVSWLLTDSILKFWLPDTKVEDESLQVGLSLQNLQNIRFPSESYVSHVKSFNHDRTNFCFDEDWDVEESSIALFEVEVVDV